MNIKILVFLLFVIIGGCAKKPSYQEKFKEPELTDISRDYDLNAFYLFVPSSLTAPYDISEVIPYEKGQALRVKLKFVEDGLEVYAPDEQFSAERNQGRVMLIPGKYLSYKCDTNSLGECTNREVENEEISWRDRKYFLPSHNNISIFGWHKADIGMSTNPCYNFEGSSVEKLEIRNGMIYLIIARHYSADIDKCNFRELPVERASFSVRVSYQLIRENDIVSKDFKAMPYSDIEQRLFGAFKFTTKNFDVTFSKEIEKNYLMRINPDKKVVTYYLSPEFKIPEFNYLRTLTEKAFTAFNKGLESAGTGMQIELKDLPEGISVGDIRYNMINLLTDPSSTGILGFAPYTPNPQTGELIHVSVQMFYGSMLSQTKIIYEAMREKGEQLKPVILPTPVVTTPTEVVSLNRVETNRRPTNVKKKVINKSSKKGGKVTPNKKLITKDGRRPKSIGEEQIDFKSPQAEKEWADKFPDIYKITKTDYDAEVRKTKKLMDVCAYPSSEFVQGLRGKNYISAFTNCGSGPDGNKDSKFCENYELKPWDKLTEGEQKEVSKLIISFSWQRILIHELGHNFSLRHNFKGNFDEENFYTLKELNDEIAPEKFDRVPQYSSIMDYAYTDLGQLPVLGKYDVAALRYIYTGKIETTIMKDNKKVSKIVTPAELPNNAIPKYLYCTDENVGADASCHRHDEGKSYSDLADHYLEKYQNNKIYTNFRSGKTNFDQIRSLSRYFYHRQDEFQMWRDLYE
ncbi:MAG: zinc-dependent metalloprotease, partial [Bacteriovoracales bacterium]